MQLLGGTQRLAWPGTSKRGSTEEAGRLVAAPPSLGNLGPQRPAQRRGHGTVLLSVDRPAKRMARPLSTLPESTRSSASPSGPYGKSTEPEPDGRSTSFCSEVKDTSADPPDPPEPSAASEPE